MKQKSKNIFLILLYLVKHPRRFYNALSARGKKWAMRGLILLLIILIAVPAAFWYQAKHAKAAWWNDDWAYRIAIPVTNNTTQQTNVYISTTVNTSDTTRFQADCGDIRFTDLHGVQLPYYIESGCGTASTVIRVSFDVFPAGAQTIYMYYGNPSAPNGFVAPAGSGSVTEANMRLSMIAGTAFTDFSVANTLTQFSGNQLAISDSAGKKLTGNIKAAGTGETYSANLVTNPTFDSDTTGWSIGRGSMASVAGGQSNNGLQLTSDNTAGGPYAYQTISGATNKLMKMSVYAKNGTDGAQAGGIYLDRTYGQLGFTTTNSWTQYTGYQNVTGTTFYIQNFHASSGSTMLFDEVSVQQVLTPSATGVTITSTANGSTYNWTSEEAGFNRNDASNYTYIVYPMAFSTEASNYTVGSLGAEERGPGPVAYWKFDEGQGGTTQDATVNNNDGTLGNSPANPTWKSESDCVSGKCLDFDGSDDYINDGTGSSLNISDGITISLWTKMHDAGTDISVNQYFVNKASDGTAANSAFSLDLTNAGAGDYIRFELSDGSSFSGTRTEGAKIADYDPSKWYHIVGSWDGPGTPAKLYINSVLINTGANFNGPINPLPSVPVLLGKRGDNSRYLDGILDEVKIFPYARTADQIKQDYNAGLAGQSTSQGAAAAVGESPKWMTDGLVGQWKMDETSGTTVADSSGNGNIGTLTNAQETDTASAASTTTSVVATSGASLSATDDVYNNMILRVTGGGGCGVTTGTERTITDYTGASKTFNVAAYSAQADSCTFEVRHQTGGKFEKGLGFEGNNDYVSLSGFNYQSNISTINFWSKCSTAGAGSYKPAFVKYTDTNHRIDSGFSTNCQNFYPVFSNGSSNTGTNLYVRKDFTSWRFISMVVDTNSINIYVDGKIEKSYSYSTALTGISGNQELGRRGGEYSSTFLDDVRIYNRALSPDEVKQLSQWGPGPTGWWKMDDNVSGDSKTLVDSSASSNNATTYYGANAAGMDCSGQGKFGGACRLDGVDDRIEINNYDLWNIRTTDSITVEAWVKIPDGLNGSGGYVFFGSGSGPVFYMSGSNQNYNLGWYVPGQSHSSSTLFYDPNRWYHIAMVRESNNRMTFYRDGVAIGSDTLTDQDLASVDFYENPIIGGGSWPFKGLIDDVRYYKYARSPAQINQDMAGNINASATSSGGVLSDPVASYKFDEGFNNAMNTTQDWSQNDQDLTLVNTPAWTNAGKFAKALDFEKDSSEYGWTADSAAISITGDLTVSAWIKPESVTGSTLFDIAGKWDGANESYLLAQYGSELRMYIDASGSYKTTSGLGLQAGTWYYVTATYNASAQTVSLYVNGIDKGGSVTGTIPASIGDDAGRFQVGAEDSTTSAGNFYDGLIDELKIYSSALTPDQIAIDMNGGKEMQLGGEVSATGATGAAAEYCVPGDSTSCDGPVGEWKFDEKTGGTVNDTSGNGNNGTWYGTGTHWTRGIYGSAGKFNGNDAADYVSAPDSPSLRTFWKTAYTLSFWFNKGGESGQLFFKNSGTGGSGYFRIEETSGHLWAVIWDGTNMETYNAPDVGNNIWTHYTLVFNNSVLRWYVNGIAQDPYTLTTINLNNFNPLSSLDFGYNAYWPDYSRGLLDDVLLYNYARTPAQIAWDYNRGKPVAWWKMDEGQGDKAYDSSGFSNTGTLTAMDPLNDWVDGKFGKGLDFDGSSDYVNAGDVGALNNASAFTISAWINDYSLSDNGRPIDKFSDGNNDISLAPWSNDLYFELGNGSNSYACWTGYSSTISPQTWYHVSVVYDGSGADNSSKVKMFVNGIQRTLTFDGTFPTISPNLSGINLNFSRPVAGNYFQGKMDDVRIYNYPLTAEQVKQVMNNGMGMKFGDQ